jgi:1-deoxy-D-xylulose-5-phosphate reductoisomerase
MQPTSIAVLGSTGSIGRQTLQIVERFPERLRVRSLAGRRVDVLREQAARFGAAVVCVAADAGVSGPAVAEGFPAGCRVVVGAERLPDLAADPEAERVVVATVGEAGLDATLAAARAGKTILLANKEVLVAAGAVVMAAVKDHGARLYPVDSEHSALWQCLAGERPEDVERLILTASGGALRHRPIEDLARVTPTEALAHPTWTMGRKVTIDSATLMNKGMEVIEARWLFNVGYDRIEVVLHGQSIIHSLVAFRDGSLKAQVGLPDMRLPIQLALSYPERWTSPELGCNVGELPSLTFGRPDLARYPCLALALEAGRRGGTYPAALAGADEEAVELFLGGAIGFAAIPVLVEEALSAHVDEQPAETPSLEAIRAAGEGARRLVATRARTDARLRPVVTA